MPKDYPSVILPPIWREAIEMPPVYPSSAPLVCFQGYTKQSRYNFTIKLRCCFHCKPLVGRLENTFAKPNFSANFA